MATVAGAAVQAGRRAGKHQRAHNSCSWLICIGHNTGTHNTGTWERAANMAVAAVAAGRPAPISEAQLFSRLLVLNNTDWPQGGWQGRSGKDQHAQLC